MRFVPATNFHGTPGTLTVRLIDSSSAFTPYTNVDVSNDTALSGGTTRYSNSSNTVTLGTSIAAVNDAPTLTSAALTSVNEDVASVANTGSTISALFSGQYGDATDNQSAISGGGNTSTVFAGLAILGNTADSVTQGKWQYSVSAGVWVDLAVGATLGTAGTAVILPTSASLRFQPVANYNGTPPSLSVSALDTSTGGAIAAPQTGQTIATTGGTTRYSTPTTLTTTVNPINDAPTLSGLTAKSFTEDGSAVVIGTSATLADTELSLFAASYRKLG